MQDIEKFEDLIDELEQELASLRRKHNATSDSNIRLINHCQRHKAQVYAMKSMIDRLCSALGDYEVNHPSRLDAIEMTRKITPGAVIHAKYE